MGDAACQSPYRLHLLGMVELGFDEIKTHLLAAAHGNVQTVYRGRTPAMVEQEFWASMTLYTLVRGLMARAARAHGIDPRRISFVDALLVIKLAACSTSGRAPQNLHKRYERLLEDLERYPGLGPHVAAAPGPVLVLRLE